MAGQERTVGESDVIRAGMEILLTGRQPSVRDIREVIGFGSMTTIQKHMEAFWLMAGKSLQGKAGLPEESEDAQLIARLDDEVRSAFMTTIRKAEEVAALRLESRRLEYQQQAEDLIASYKLRFESSEAERNRLIERVTALARELEAKAGEIAELTGVSAALREELSATKEQLISLQAELRSTQERYQAEIAANDARHTSKVEALNQTIKHWEDQREFWAQETVNAREEGAARLERERLRWVQEKKEINDDRDRLRRQSVDNSRELGSARRELGQAEGRCMTLEASVASLREELQSLAKRFEKVSSENIGLKRRLRHGTGNVGVEVSS